MKTSLPLLALPFLAGALQLGAATLPYTNDFSGAGANTAFTTETADAQWALNDGSYQNTYTATNTSPTSTSIELTGLGENAFTLETQFTVQSNGSINSNGATLGLALFSSSPTFEGSNVATSYYLADLTYGNSADTGVGRLRIVALGDTSGFTATNSLADDNASANLAITLGTTYTLRLTGAYDGEGALTMTFGLFDATGTTQIGTSATATDTSPLTGTDFGYRNRIGMGGGTSIIDFDNFSLATAVIPEPSAFALLGGLAALGLATLRRRRRQSGLK